jgi:hypothetical protein
MTDKDLKLMQKAKGISCIDWQLIENMVREADTAECRKHLHDLATRMHHKEEELEDMI